jgi:hypothetical protein
MSKGQATNERIAELLNRAADLLARQDDANPYRIRSYRRAAEAIRSLDEPVAELVEREGKDALRDIRGVGQKLAGAMMEILDTGRLGLLDRLEGQTSPEEMLARVPGIGSELAERIHQDVGVSTLEELEVAAHDGRLAKVEGIGESRLQGIRDALAGMLSRSAQRRVRPRQEKRGEPPVSLLLAIDQEYRRKAEAGQLRTIAPKRFNPSGEAWLPIMNAERDGWSFTALFSNTARAHELGTTTDWVVIYYEDGGQEDQCTVVTARSGPLKGKRVIRGRESECREHHGI